MFPTDYLGMKVDVEVKSEAKEAENTTANFAPP